MEIGTNGLALMTAITSTIKVDNTIWVRHDGLVCLSMKSNICLEMPIIRSQTSPMWEEWEELKTQVQPSSPKYQVPSTLGHHQHRSPALQSVWHPCWRGWYAPKIGRYHHSSHSSGGANSAWSWSKIFCMKFMQKISGVQKGSFHLRPPF